MLGEVFAFLSGLYFRGKLLYALTFASRPKGVSGVYVITTNRGLMPPQQYVTIDELRAMGVCSIDHADEKYRGPLERDLKKLHEAAGSRCEFVLLGSIA